MVEVLSDDPVAALDLWIKDARNADLRGARTMSLATTDTNGPHARTVLVEIAGRSLRFNSYASSVKVKNLIDNPRCAGVFHWPALGRQVAMEGKAHVQPESVSSLEYRRSSRQLQLLAWIYEESELNSALSHESIADCFSALSGHPRADFPPSGWTTVDIEPTQLDFWQAGSSTTPPSRTRFTMESAGRWVRFPVLP